MEKQIDGRFFALPNSREFEMHLGDGTVIFGRIHENVSADSIAKFNASNNTCTATVIYVGRQHPTLIEIREV